MLFKSSLKRGKWKPFRNGASQITYGVVKRANADQFFLLCSVCVLIKKCLKPTEISVQNKQTLVNVRSVFLSITETWIMTTSMKTAESFYRETKLVAVHKKHK